MSYTRAQERIVGKLRLVAPDLSLILLYFTRDIILIDKKMYPKNIFIKKTVRNFSIRQTSICAVVTAGPRAPHFQPNVHRHYSFEKCNPLMSSAENIAC